MARLGLAAPWVIFYREIEAMFVDDPEVRVIYDEEHNEIKLYVNNGAKADALSTLLPQVKTFGNVELKITVIPANDHVKYFLNEGNIYETAFEGNPALSYIRIVGGIFSNDIVYIVFVNKVVQYYSDDLGDVNGMTSTLYQEIAKDIFGEREGIFFCTDLPATNATLHSLGEPLGEWP